MPGEWNDKIFGVQPADFEALALEIFRYQVAGNHVYRDFCAALHVDPGQVKRLEQIPFLPIRFFKSHRVLTGGEAPAQVFESSGTTGMVTSRHYVTDTLLYEQSFLRSFEQYYGSPTDWRIIGLLPSYLERGNSSLVYMTDRLIRESRDPMSGFYLHEFKQLAGLLQQGEKEGKKTLLIGVTFALLDLAEQFPMPLQHSVIMETGGMKGRRVEMTRPEVHEKLKQAFRVPVIHSEYGMTELLSQAWSDGEGLFKCPAWMSILVRDEEDPLSVKAAGNRLEVIDNRLEVRDEYISGAINVIDLANVNSCSFIATDDAGKLYADGRFEVLGRMDGSDMRGCSLLVVS